MSKSIVINAESINKALESKPTSLTGLWKALGGSGSVSGSAAKRMREAVPGIEAILAKIKAGTAKAEGQVVPPKGKRPQKADRKPTKVSKKSSVPHDIRNPFRKWDSGYGLLVDLIASAGPKGIGKETLLSEYCRITGKDLQHAKYDLAVINSAKEDSDKRHRSCADGFTILKEGDNYRVRFP
jgi:hypothetical protein